MDNITEAFNDLIPFLAMPLSFIVIKFIIDIVISIVGGGIAFCGSTSKKERKEKKRKTRIRPNEYGEYDYNYSNNNYECEGCK